MDPKFPTRAVPRPQILAERAYHTLERFLHIEAASGVVLLIAATVALVWANSPLSGSYHDFWHLPLSIGLGEHTLSKSLHFLINDGLMTIFFSSWEWRSGEKFTKAR